MNGDIWPYGFAANRTVIEAMIRWSQNDELLARNLVAASNDGPTILGGFKKRVEGIAWTLTDSNKEKLSASKIKEAKKMAERCTRKNYKGC
jgi:hypothetical protein